MPSLDTRPLLFVMSGPSGAGKSTAVNALVEARLVVRLVTFTTRPIRESEEEGVEYNFVSDRSFINLCRQGKIVEYQRRYSGHYYGSPQAVLSAAPEHPVVTHLDPLGFFRVRAASERRVVGIFVTPSSHSSILDRLRDRRMTTDLDERATDYARQIPFAVGYDYVIVNDDKDEFIHAVESVVRSEVSASKSARWLKKVVLASAAASNDILKDGD